MSYASNYLELRKKRMEEENKTKRKSYSNGNSTATTVRNAISKAEKNSALAWRDDEIAPVRETSGYFQKSAHFDDGYQVGDVIKTAGSTAADVGENVAKGGANWLEKLWDGMLTFGTKMNESSMMQAAQSEMIYNTISGNKESASKTLERYTRAQEEAEKATAEYVAKDIIKEENIDFGADEYSVLGEKSDALVQSGTELVIRKGISMIPVVGVPLAYATTAFSSMGGEAENAFKEGATYDEAVLSGLWTASVDVIGEHAFGGIKIGGKTLSDVALSKFANVVSSKTLRTLAKWGINTFGEGVEEDFQGYLSAVGQKMTYLNEKELDEIFTSEDHWDNFLGGVILGGFFDGINIATSKAKGIDYVTGLKNSDKAVLDKVYNEVVAEKEKAKGKKLTAKEKTAIFDDIIAKAEKGYISTDTIEEVLGGEDYKAYKEAADLADGMTNEYTELGNKEHFTLADQYILQLSARRCHTHTFQQDSRDSVSHSSL